MSNKKTNKAVTLQQQTEKKGRNPSVWLEKLGTYLIDVSKYLLTGVLISSLLSDYEDNHLSVYWFGGLSAILTLVVGLMLVN